MGKKSNRKGKEIIGVMGLLIVVIILNFTNQELLAQVGLVGALLGCEYAFFGRIALERGLKKMLGIEYIVYMLGIVSILEASVIGVKDASNGVLMLVAMLVIGIRSGIYYFKCNNVIEKIAIYLGWILFIFVYALLVSTINVTMFLLIKVCCMFIVASGVKITSRLTPGVGVAMIIVVYILMVVASGMLTSDFLYAPLTEGWQYFYEGVKNIYSWPDELVSYEKIKVIEVLVAFISGRIMDAVLIGVLVERINKMIDVKGGE